MTNDEILGPYETCPDCCITYTDTRPEAFRDVTFIQTEEGCDHCTPLKEAILAALLTLRQGTNPC